MTHPETGKSAVSGGEILLDNAALVSIAIETIDRSGKEAKVRLIRGGEVLETFSSVTPFVIDYIDELPKDITKTYYRIDVEGQIGVIRSNPIFAMVSQ